MNDRHLMHILLSAALVAGFSGYAAAQPANKFHPAGLNPQPEPPSRAAKSAGHGAPVNPGTIRGFNPQPEPPGHSANAIIDDNHKGHSTKSSGHGTPENPATTHGFNPQPEPPG